MKDLKYLFAYTVPLSGLIAFHSHGIGTYTTVFYAFIVLPFLDLFTRETKTNLTKDQASDKRIPRPYFLQ